MYWKNLFTLILEVIVRAIGCRPSISKRIKQHLLYYIKRQKTNLFQNFQMYFTHHYRIRLTTLEVPKRSRQSSQFPFLKQGNAWNSNPTNTFKQTRGDNNFENILVLFCQHAFHSKDAGRPRIILNNLELTWAQLCQETLLLICSEWRLVLSRWRVFWSKSTHMS